MGDQSDYITRISIDEDDDINANDMKIIEKEEDTTPYLINFNGPIEELFTTITCCHQWPSDIGIKLYYNCLPKVPMMDKKGKKFIPHGADHQLDLIILSTQANPLTRRRRSQYTAFSLATKGQPQSFVAHLKKIIRFISKPQMQPFDFLAVGVFITDIKKFVGWQNFAYVFPILLV